MFQLDLTDRRPLYEQIREKIKELIVKGVMKPNEKIPSVREMAQWLTINPNTIQKAYKDLELKGFIYSVRAKGSFVTPLDQIDNQGKRDELIREVERIGRELLYLNIPKEDIIAKIEEIYAEKEAGPDD
ncbi:MAG: GntR family transcriptional regulator [Dehalobacterium sp.]